MNRTVWGLFSLQFDEKFDLLKTHDPKRMIWGIGKYLLGAAALTVLSYLLFARFALLGFRVTSELLALILAGTQLVTVLFALGHTVQTLFMSRDTELLFSLPASGEQVFLSKLLLSYIHELLVGMVVNLPLLVALPLISVSGGFGLGYYLTLLPVLLMLPMLPLALALLLAAPTFRLLRFLKKHPAVSVVLLLGLVAGFILVYVKLIAGISAGFALASDQLGTVACINDAIALWGSRLYPFTWVARAMTGAAGRYILVLYLAGCLLLFAVACITLRPIYFDLAAGSLEDGSGGESGRRRFVFRSPFLSLIEKEIKCVFRSPGTVFDCFLFVILMPLIVFMYDHLLLDLVVNDKGTLMIRGAHLLIVAIFAVLANIYASGAVSREGSNFYLMKSMPVDFYTQMGAKVVFQTAFSVGGLLLTGVASCFYMNAGAAWLSTAVGIFLSLAHAFYCFDVDLCHPCFDSFEGESTHVNGNTTKCLLMGLLMALLVGGGAIVISASTGNGTLAFLLMLALAFAYACYRAYVLFVRVYYQFERLETA